MKLGWKVMGGAVLITIVGMMAQSTALAMIGGVCFWVGVGLLFTNIRSKPKRGAGSGKL
jgi:hypothetical protein